jgi:HK97 gp10 family phage protein
MLKVEFSGGRELEQALQDLGKRTVAKRTAERALKKAAEPIRDRWVQLAPQDQGDLKSAIKIGRAIKSVQKRLPGEVAATFVGIDESVDRRLHIYAEVQEFGNESNPAQPAGRPAWESQKDVALDRLADDLRSEIEKSKARAARKAARLAG